MPETKRSLNDAWRDAARDLDDVAIDAALEARVIAAATKPKSNAPVIAGAAAVVVVSLFAFRAASGDALVVEKSPGAVVAVEGSHAVLREGRARFTIDADDDAPVVIDAGERRLTATDAAIDVEIDGGVDGRDRGGGRAVIAEGSARLAVVADGSFEELHAGDSRSWRNRPLTARAAVPTTTSPLASTPTPKATAVSATTAAVATTALNPKNSTPNSTPATTPNSTPNSTPIDTQPDGACRRRRRCPRQDRHR